MTNTRPTPSVVTDDGLVERTEIPIETIWALGEIIREASVNTPLGPRSVGYYISVGLDHFNHPHDRFQELLNAAARAALAASDRDVLVGRIAELEDLLAEYGDRVRMARAEPAEKQWAIDEAMGNAAERAALIPLAEEL